MNPSRTFSVPAFQPIDSLAETTQLGAKLLTARNLILRPQGGFKGGPTYGRLWAIGNSLTIYATIVALGLNDSHKTVALRVARQGKNFLLFYNLPARQCRGFFYLGDDGTYTSGTYDFTAGTPTWEILGTGFDNTARWYGTRFFTAIYLGNGVDDNYIAQLSRTDAVGKWRKSGSNVAPAAPVISLTTPATTTNTQAYWAVTGRAGGVVLTFTARAALFPGLSGNNKIKVQIQQSGAGQALLSSLSGQGTTADPYFYTLTAGTAALANSNSAITSFVNADSKAITLLEASTATPDSTVDLGSYGPTDLANGAGSGISSGFTNRTVTFFARYWDPGTDLLGYEGISSALSNELAITAASYNDVRVLVPVDSTAEGGRFPYIRLYMQYGEVPEETYLLVDPDNPVPNGLTDTFTRYAATSEIVLASTAWTAGDKVRLTTTGALPAPLAAATDYYLQTRVATGTLVRLGSTDGVSMTGGTLAAGDRVTLTTTGTLPGGLAPGTNYFLKPRAEAGTFTRYPATHQLVLLGSEFMTNDAVTLTTTGVLPGGLSTGTTYYLNLFTGGRYYLSLTPGGVDVTLTDDGTGVHTATLQPASGQFFLSLTSGGSTVAITDSGTGVQTATLVPTPGQWTLALTADGTAVVLTDAGSGVHTATLTAKTVQIGTNTPIRTAADGGEMFEDQYRPLPHKHHAMASEQVYRGAVTQYPQRLYPSKPATFDELAPEGVSLAELSVIDLQTTTGSPGSTDITALISTQSRLDIHTRGGLIILDTANPTDPVSQYSPQSGAGCVNGTSFTLLEGKSLYYLGADLQLRSMSAQRIGNDFASMVAQTDFVARAANAYLRTRVDIDALARTPQRGCLFVDRQSQHLWFTLPVLDGSLNMFGFDLANNGLVGPFDYPRIYAQAPMESERAEMVFADESGNLFVWDTATQNDAGDAFNTSSAFTPYSPSDPVPVQYAGYGYVDLGGVRYYQANTTVLETGYIDLAGADTRKALIALLWRTVKNSRAILNVTVTTLNQEVETLSFSESEFYPEVEHRLNCLLGNTTSFKLAFNVLGAEQKPWIVRDISALWKGQGKV